MIWTVASPAFRAAVLHRADAHERMLVVWRSDMGKSRFADALPSSNLTARVDDAASAADENGAKVAQAHGDEDSTDDDHSSIYLTVSDGEDEPSAEL